MARKSLSIIMAALASASAAAQESPAVLLELFTSQSCYSCPPAEKLLAEKFIGRDDVIALELHVDYWDDLIYWGSSWKDPYSSNAFTQRQVNYAATTRNNPFTPQAIVQGAYSASGTNRNALETAIERVKELNLSSGWQVSFANDGDTWHAVIDKAAEDAVVHTVIFRSKVRTQVLGGENKGKTLDNHNVVIEFDSHGRPQAGETIAIGKVGEGHGCALIIQRPPQGVVLGAWACPVA